MKSQPASIGPYVRIFGRYLREQGLPVTQQREAVAEVVFSSPEHLSVDDIERELRRRGMRIGKATVYRTLDLLVRSRLVEEHDFEEGFKRYEHRLSREPIHAHLVCVDSGEIVEFRSEALLRIIESVAAEHGFEPLHHKFVIFGLSERSVKAGAAILDEGLTCPIETS